MTIIFHTGKNHKERRIMDNLDDPTKRIDHEGEAMLAVGRFLGWLVATGIGLVMLWGAIHVVKWLWNLDLF
jgi:hypothetical protein